MPQVQGGCPACGYGTFTGIPLFYSYCPPCHGRLKNKQQIRFRREAAA